MEKNKKPKYPISWDILNDPDLLSTPTAGYPKSNTVILVIEETDENVFSGYIKGKKEKMIIKGDSILEIKERTIKILEECNKIKDYYLYIEYVYIMKAKT